MKRNLTIFILISVVAFNSNSQNFDISVGGSHLRGTYSPHISYGFFCDIGFKISNRASIYSGFESNFIKHHDYGTIWPPCWPAEGEYYAGDFSTNHTFALYGIPLFFNFKIFNFKNLSFQLRSGVLNNFVVDKTKGNPDEKGSFDTKSNIIGYKLFGLSGFSIDYRIGEKYSLFINEQFIGSYNFSIDFSNYFFNSQIGIKFSLK